MAKHKFRLIIEGEIEDQMEDEDKALSKEELEHALRDEDPDQALPVGAEGKFVGFNWLDGLEDDKE